MARSLLRDILKGKRSVTRATRLTKTLRQNVGGSGLRLMHRLGRLLPIVIPQSANFAVQNGGTVQPMHRFFSKHSLFPKFTRGGSSSTCEPYVGLVSILMTSIMDIANRLRLRSRSPG